MTWDSLFQSEMDTAIGELWNETRWHVKYVQKRELELIKMWDSSRLMSVSVWSTHNEQSPSYWKSQTPAAC